MNEQRIRRDIITIGGSAGSVELLLDLFRHLPDGLGAAFFVVIHRSPHFESRLVELIRNRSALEAREPDSGEPVRTNCVYLAPRDLHMRLKAGAILLDRGPKEHFTRPAVDPLFTSAARTYGKRVAGLVYSGGGSDGASGLIDIKRARGLTIVQDPREAPHPSMPATGIKRDDVDAILPARYIPRALTAVIRGDAFVEHTERVEPEDAVDLI